MGGGTMGKRDDVFAGQRAKAWMKEIGQYGDLLRMVIVNKLVARTLNHFGGEGARVGLVRPHALIQESIAALLLTADRPVYSQIQRLVEAHKDVRGLADEFPSLGGTSLLDLGSGSGHLGGWLSTLGVDYTGVEPSTELHRAAERDSRLSNASLFQATIRDFCRSDSYPHDDPPTLISLIGVVDHLGDPEGDMRELFDFIARRNWPSIPILVATFDPDFFLPDLPARDIVLHPSAHYGVIETLRICDPAIWEELFVNGGFHVLEQRPLHISGLPTVLSEHLQELHNDLFPTNMLALGGGDTGGNPVARQRVPPRQGPFYFWLLCPRSTTINRLARAAKGGWAPQSVHAESYAQDEALSVIGNLGLRVYRLLKGRAYFDSAETGRMSFEPNDLFGQLETASNYVSSRVFGTLTACAGSRIETFESHQVLRYLTGSDRFTDELFLSLLKHLSSVQFAPFATAKRLDSKKFSEVLIGRQYSAQTVRNVAACLLQTSANTVSDALSSRYRSRVLVELDRAYMAKFVFGPTADREAERLMPILPELVQSNVIDSFSAYSLEMSGAQETIHDLENASEAEPGPLHIGWQVARYIRRCIALRDTEEQAVDIVTLALAISAFLGSDNDRSEFQAEFAAINQSQLRDHEQSNAPGKATILRMPRTEDERRNHILALVQASSDKEAALRKFLDLLRSGFDYREKGNFAQKYGLSRFMVIRDIWALIACLLDDGRMWNTARMRIKRVNDYLSEKEQRPRIVAYIQECVAYAADKSGLDNDQR